MHRALRLFERIHGPNAILLSVALALAALWVDYITGRDIQFPLVYVLPVGLAAWRNQGRLAYALAMTLPVARGAFELPWDTGAPPAVAVLNVVIEMAALMLYAYLVDKSAAQKRRLERTITTRELEIGRLRTFAKMTSTTLQGRGLSPGMAEGVAHIYAPPDDESTFSPLPIAPDEVETEINRLDAALAAAICELDRTQRNLANDIGAAESALLDVHLAMLNDAEFWNKCKWRVEKDLIKAEQVVAEEVREMVATLDALKQDAMWERSADIRDVGRRVLRNIGASGESAAHRLASIPPGTILVATELLPSDIFELDHAKLVALVTERNSATSHVAILARIRNIPAVTDIRDATALLATGDRLLVDAEAGTVTAAPTKVQADLFAARRSLYAANKRAAAGEEPRESATKDDVRIGLYANIARADEAHFVLEYRLDGVGLFRSEFLFLNVPEPPTLDAQVAAYSAVAKALSPRPVVIRTMDFGGDKLPRHNSAESDMAFRMGKRGLAFSLTERTMFRTQLHAILRAAQWGELGIMFPMVTGVAELRAARDLVDEVIAAEQLGRHVSIGAMVETPAAVFHIHEIVKMVDFVSIGTNDLAHFILARDRQAQESPGTPSFLHPSVLRATEQVVRAALDQGIGLTVCGEAAGNPAAVCLLVGMGVRQFSMNPFQVARIRRFLRQLTVEQMANAARDALRAATPAEVGQIAAAALRETDADADADEYAIPN
jgi:phosphoenolpyruvate-protein phosphotransferase (PTS system enzyme I)